MTILGLILAIVAGLAIGVGLGFVLWPHVGRRPRPPTARKRHGTWLTDTLDDDAIRRN